MQAMILSAGRGERMRPLTDTCPKPLLPVNGKSLVHYHLEKLVKQGVKRVVINHAWLGHLIEQQLGDGRQFGLEICYSPEPHGGLETAGGIIRALPLLGDEPFWVINGDIYTEFDFAKLPRTLAPNHHAHLLLVPNPSHHPHGDFGLKHGILQPRQHGIESFTYAGMGLYSPQFFADYHPGSEQFLKLRPLLEQGVAGQRIAATVFHEYWTDVGTPARLTALANTLQGQCTTRNTSEPL